MSEGKFSYSFNEEYYNGSFETREEALQEALAQNNEDQRTIWTGQNYTPSRSVYAEYVIEQVAEHTTEESGDWSGGYLLGLSKEVIESLQARLQLAWDEWEKEHGLEPEWFNVDSVQEHKVSKEEA